MKTAPKGSTPPTVIEKAGRMYQTCRRWRRVVGWARESKGANRGMVKGGKGAGEGGKTAPKGSTPPTVMEKAGRSYQTFRGWVGVGEKGVQRREGFRARGGNDGKV
jgi:hypothetical protein